jgi:hypothetical protein
MTTYDKHDLKALDDECYPVVTMVQSTHEQRTALFNRWKRNDCCKTWREFAKSAHPTFGMNGAITVLWAGMWLLIEKDGYCHT